MHVLNSKSSCFVFFLLIFQEMNDRLIPLSSRNFMYLVMPNQMCSMQGALTIETRIETNKALLAYYFYLQEKNLIELHQNEN